METEQPLVLRSEALVVWLVTAAVALLGIVWALVVPMFQAPDEAQHVDSALHLALGDGWAAPAHERMLAAVNRADDTASSTPPPHRVTWGALLAEFPGESAGVDQMTQHPPTYYLIAAGVLRAIGFEHVRWDLAVVALRLLGVAFITPVPAFAWMALRRLTKSPPTAVVGAVTVLAVAQMTHIGASVTNDSPVILLGAVAAWLVVRVLTGARTWQTLVALGATVAALAWFKGTGLTVIPFAAVAVIAGPARGSGARARARDGVLTLGVAAAAGAWWWLHNLIVYGTLQPNGLPRETLPWAAGTGPDLGYFVNNDWQLLSQTFWGKFGKLQFPMSPIVTDLLTFAAVLGIIVAVSAGRSRRNALVLAVLPAVVLVLVVESNWSSYGMLQTIAAAQGRYFFVAIVPLIALAAIGWRRLLGPSDVLVRRFGVAVVVGAPLMAIYGLSIAYRGFYEAATTSVTRTGLAHLAYLTPAGRVPLAIAGVLTVLVLAAVVVVALRVVRRPTLDQ